jgi:hypothetical protein
MSNKCLLVFLRRYRGDLQYLRSFGQKAGKQVFEVKNLITILVHAKGGPHSRVCALKNSKFSPSLLTPKKMLPPRSTPSGRKVRK